MRRASNRPGPRPGFTLVELLVVMTIIAILFALAAAAVVKALGKADETKTRHEISQLANGVQAFKTDFGVAYIPDKLVLPPGYDAASLQYISSLWPRLGTGITPNSTNSNPLSQGTNSFTFVGQTQSYTPFSYWGVPGNQPIVLQGYQTIVFFLGGAGVTAASPLGFSTNPLDPMNTSGQTGAANRKGPYFDNFPPARLQVLPSDQKNGNPYPGFIDTYGTMPYLYFSASKAGNDYSTTYTYNASNYPASTQNGTTAAGTTFAVVPFQISSSRFANANGFQIVAAGRDTLFNDQPTSSNPNPYAGGTLWPGYPGGGTDMSGYDNMANFHPVLLGIPAQ